MFISEPCKTSHKKNCDVEGLESFVKYNCTMNATVSQYVFYEVNKTVQTLAGRKYNFFFFFFLSNSSESPPTNAPINNAICHYYVLDSSLLLTSAGINEQVVGPIMSPY